MRGLRAVVAVLSVGIPAAVACGATATTSAPPRLAVTPAAGHPRTVFTVHFTAPAPSGPSGTQSRAYHLSADPAQARRGCIASVSLTPLATSAGEAMAVRLSPRSLGGRWCAERYSGEVSETIQPVCQPIRPHPAIACPDYIAFVPIGHFSFRVRR